MIRVGRGLYYRSMGSDMCGEVTHSWGGCPDRSLDLVSVPIGKVGVGNVGQSAFLFVQHNGQTVVGFKIYLNPARGRGWSISLVGFSIPESYFH